MALSLVGWMNGLSASGIVIFGCLFGLLWMYKAKKTNAKLLFYWGLATLFLSLCWLGDLVDFVTILLTGKNMDNSYGLYCLISWMWIPPSTIVGLYIGAELLIPEKKRYVLSIYTILGVIFEIFLFFDVMNSAVFFYPKTPGEDLISLNFVYSSPLGILYIILSLSNLLILSGFIFIIFQSTGLVRKKFLILLIAFLLLFICGILEVSSPPGIIKIFIRIGVVISYWIWYLGLREVPEKKEKMRPKKEVKVEGDLFRISQYKKEDLTEEEVSISKEKKICLVCKGRVRKYNVYICDCDTFYCEKCARALENIENECWVCNAPIDESKPVKPFKRDDEIEVETSEKPQKKPKTKK